MFIVGFPLLLAGCFETHPPPDDSCTDDAYFCCEPDDCPCVCADPPPGPGPTPGGLDEEPEDPPEDPPADPPEDPPTDPPEDPRCPPGRERWIHDYYGDVVALQCAPLESGTCEGS